MSKYDLLWEKIDLLFKQAGKEQLTLKFEEIENLCGKTIEKKNFKLINGNEKLV